MTRDVTAMAWVIGMLLTAVQNSLDQDQIKLFYYECHVYMDSLFLFNLNIYPQRRNQERKAHMALLLHHNGPYATRTFDYWRLGYAYSANYSSPE